MTRTKPLEVGDRLMDTITGKPATLMSIIMPIPPSYHVLFVVKVF